MKRDWRGRFAVEMSLYRKITGSIAVLCVLTIAGNATVQWMTPTTLFYKATGHAEAAELPAIPSEMDVMLEKIAKCESGGRQFWDDGRVVLNVNKDGSADVGYFQINLRYHGAEIARQKLDVVNSEEDNRKFAEWLYQKNGTADWNASRVCWSK